MMLQRSCTVNMPEHESMFRDSVQKPNSFYRTIWIAKVYVLSFSLSVEFQNSVGNCYWCLFL